MKKLSVVIPSKNGFDILREFLPAIIKETLNAGGEIIVVDDCSDDDTLSAIPKLFPEIVLLSRTENPGFCHAVNLGMKHAEGKYLLLLNNDTVPEKNSFKQLVSALKKSKDKTAVAVPSIIRPDGTDDSNYMWIFHHGLAVTGENLKGKEYPSGACALWKKHVWEELGGLSTLYAPIYWEDTDLGVRMQANGYDMIKCPEISVRHLHAATMGSSLISETLRERNRFIFMDENCNTFKQRLERFVWMPLHYIAALLQNNKAFTHGYRDYLRFRKGLQ